MERQERNRERARRRMLACCRNRKTIEEAGRRVKVAAVVQNK